MSKAFLLIAQITTVAIAAPITTGLIPVNGAGVISFADGASTIQVSFSGTNGTDTVQADVNYWPCLPPVCTVYGTFEIDGTPSLEALLNLSSPSITIYSQSNQAIAFAPLFTNVIYGARVTVPNYPVPDVYQPFTLVDPPLVSTVEAPEPCYLPAMALLYAWLRRHRHSRRSHRRPEVIHGDSEVLAD